MKFITHEGLGSLLSALEQDGDVGYDVFGPQRRRDAWHLGRLEANGSAPTLPWNDYRLPESLKSVYFPTGREVAHWTDAGPEEARPLKPRAIFGVKACDLRALKILDTVFRDHDFQEPTWCRARADNLVVSGDCTGCTDSCFCTMMDGTPFATDTYDLNLAPVDGGYVVESGSRKGDGVIENHAPLFRDARDAERETRDANRRELTERVRHQNDRWPTKDPFSVSVEKNTKTRIWGRLAARCVECNACNTVCPTCHCFQLLTVPTPEGSVRYSLWDSCFQPGYARMAGGGTPRLQLTERFRNHYLHKFVVFPRNWGVTACSGCGRCIDACMGKIDKRECLHRLETEWIPSEVLPEVE